MGRTMAGIDDVESSSGESDRPFDSVDPRNPQRWLGVGLLVVAIVPVITAAIRAIRRDWFPIGDAALLFIRARDVLTDNHPFLGSWSSASQAVGQNMNNPGALYDWLIAPFANVLPPGPATAVGVATVNIAMLVGVHIVSRRIGGRQFQRLALLASAAMAWSMGSELLISIVQPDAMLLPFLLLLVMLTGIAVGDDGLLPWAVALASLVLQTYLGYAYVFVIAVLAVVAIRVWRRDSVGRRPVVLSTLTGVVLWAPSVWEQLFGPGEGNLSRLVANASGGGFSLGFGHATRLVSSAVLLTPWWKREGYATAVTGSQRTETSRGVDLDIPDAPSILVAVIGITVLTAALVVATGYVVRHGMPVEGAAGVFAIVLLLGSVPALSRQPVGQAGLAIHQVQWVWALVAFVDLVLVWLIVTMVRDRYRSTLRPRVLDATIGALVVAVSLANVPFHSQPNGPLLGTTFTTAMHGVRGSIERLRDDGPVVYDLSNLLPFEPYSATMLMWMQEDGVEFRIDDDEVMIRQLGEGRRADGSERTRVFQLQGSEALAYQGPGCAIGVGHGLDDRENAIAENIVDAATTRLAAQTGESDADARASIVRREVDVFDAEQRRLVDPWIDTAFGLFAEGSACEGR